MSAYIPLQIQTLEVVGIAHALKAALDALNGVAYGDDRQIVETTTRLGDPMPDGALTICVEAV